ncbi:MAG: phosphoribosylanthranilate isomerase [Pseudomonadota bacterium]
MSVPIKICGLKTPETIASVTVGGADYVGFIFFEKSPRYVSPEQAGSLRPQASNIKVVAVTVDADDQLLDDINHHLRPDIMQLHGKEAPDRVRAVKARYGVVVMKALAIKEADDVARARDYRDAADLLLLDAKPPKGSELPGGNGVSFDWALVEDANPGLPFLLSGGIDIENVAQAANLVGKTTNSAIGLDISSGVERAPGEKDSKMIAELLNRLAETQA